MDLAERKRSEGGSGIMEWEGFVGCTPGISASDSDCSASAAFLSIRPSTPPSSRHPSSSFSPKKIPEKTGRVHDNKRPRQKRTRLTGISQRDPGRIFVAKVLPQRRDEGEGRRAQSTDHAGPEDRGLLVCRPPQVPDRLAPEPSWNSRHLDEFLFFWFPTTRLFILSRWKKDTRCLC